MKTLQCLPALLLCLCAQAQTPAKPKPKFQYESAGIQVSLPTADEPKVEVFGPASIQAAIKYLDDGSLAWVREKTCVNCHTTGPYLSERPALIKYLGAPKPEVLADFSGSIPATAGAQEVEKDGHRYYPGSWTSIWRSIGLAEWDEHINGKLSETTGRSLRDMLLRQSPNGSFVSFGEVEIPHITTDLELSLQAARAIAAAPGWLANLKDPDLITRVEKLKTWLRTAKPQNDYDRVLRLQLATYLPETVTPEQKAAALDILTAKQHPDGGWSTRDMSPVNDWHFKMSDTVLKLIASLSDAAKPESDAYMTAFAVVLMRQAGVPADDPRIQRGVQWLKHEQRISGRWWMHSLYRGNYHYSTYIATMQALKALALCGELPMLTGVPKMVGSRALPPLPEGAFTFVVIPDTQSYLGAGTKSTPQSNEPVTNPNLEAQVRWIQQNVVAQNIVFVSHVGDIVDKNNAAQWAVAKSHLDGLRGVIPFSLTVGNHDMTSSGDAKLYQAHFPAESFKSYPWYLGSYQHQRADQSVSTNNVNSVQTFTAGGHSFLHLSLECNAPDDVLAWAQDQLQKHAEKQAIITTHMDLGIIEKPKTEAGYIHDAKGRMNWVKIHGKRGNTGEQMWEKLYRHHPNLKFILSGDQSRVTALKLAAKANPGHTIHSLLSDYMSQPVLRLMRFVPSQKEVQVLTYDVRQRVLVEDTPHVHDVDHHQFTLPWER